MKYVLRERPGSNEENNSLPSILLKVLRLLLLPDDAVSQEFQAGTDTVPRLSGKRR